MLYPVNTDDEVKEIKQDTAAQNSRDWWGCFLERPDLLYTFKDNVPVSFNLEEENQIGILYEKIQHWQKYLTGHFNSCIRVPSNDIILIDSNAQNINCGAVISADVVVNDAAVITSAAVGEATVIRYVDSIREMLLNRCEIESSSREPNITTEDTENSNNFVWDKCEEIFLIFAEYAKEIIKHKSITIIDTRIRNWQAIEDTNWKQCILEITVKAETKIALSTWDELTVELQSFIKKQPEHIKALIEDKLCIDVKWI